MYGKNWVSFVKVSLLAECWVKETFSEILSSADAQLKQDECTTFNIVSEFIWFSNVSWLNYGQVFAFFSINVPFVLWYWNMIFIFSFVGFFYIITFSCVLLFADQLTLKTLIELIEYSCNHTLRAKSTHFWHDGFYIRSGWNNFATSGTLLNHIVSYCNCNRNFSLYYLLKEVQIELVREKFVGDSMRESRVWCEVGIHSVSSIDRVKVLNGRKRE